MRLRLTSLRHAPGVAPFMAMALSNVRHIAMKMAAGIPLPETSPIANPRAVLVQEEEVVEVAPDIPRGTHDGLDDHVRPPRARESIRGRIDCWIRVATVSSLWRIASCFWSRADRRKSCDWRIVRSGSPRSRGSRWAW